MLFRSVVSSGPDVIDLLDGVGLSGARVYRLPAPVLRLLPAYWRTPTQARVGPTRWLNAEPLIRSFAHSGQRGVLCAFAGADASGLVFLEQDAVVGAYTTRSAGVDGVEEIAPLLGDPRTMLFARLEGLTTPAEPARPVEPAPLPEPLLDHIEQAIRAEIHEFAGPAVAVFRSAPQTRDGLLDAAQRVEHMRLRMISPDTMQVVAERARRIITEAS